MVIPAAEANNCRALETWLLPAFETFSEVKVRPVLFRRRTLRVDLLAIPREEPYRRIALGFEVKGHAKWEEPTWAIALKQASDCVLATVEDNRPGLQSHTGKRIMAAFVWPAPLWRHKNDAESAFLSGMAQMAGYHKAGTAKVSSSRQPELELRVGLSDVWGSARGWRPHGYNILVGKWQIGSQRVSILEELNAMDDLCGIDD